MRELGEYLRDIRNKRGLSLNKVYQKTGITDSRLSKAENGAWNNLKISEIKNLADLYEVSIIQICMMAGLFLESDMEEYSSGFRHTALLDEDDKQHIQSEIDYIVKKKEG